MPKKLLISFLMLFTFTMSAQYGRMYEEFGIMAGPIFFQGDFGERGEVANTYKNAGVSGGLFYYLSLENDRSSFKDNFKVRGEVTFMSVDLQHYGPSTYSDTNFGRKLRGMRGNIKMGNVGTQLEYYPFKTDDYSHATFSPYVSGGVQLSSYSTKAYSFLGNIGVPQTVPNKYVDGFKNTTGIVFSATAGVGFRYKLADYHAIVFDARVQYFFDDWVDGMNPYREVYTENKNNDYAVIFHIGYAFYIN